MPREGESVHTKGRQLTETAGHEGTADRGDLGRTAAWHREEGEEAMNQTAIQVREATLTLPSSAPLVRITAGIGSAGQKTWNLRRTVTLIGSRRPAHIVLHDRAVSGAHCVIVNTGTDVLLKDLRSREGTFCNNARVELTALKDGDVITIGTMRMQVAIQVPADLSDDSGCGLALDDPLRFPSPISISLLHTDKQWEIQDAVTLIGRHDEAAIRLAHDDVASRHVVLFRFGTRPAVFDLGSAAGLWVNGQRCSLTPLDDGDCLTVGPFGLSVHYCERSLLEAKSPTAEWADELVPDPSSSRATTDEPGEAVIQNPLRAGDARDGSSEDFVSTEKQGRSVDAADPKKLAPNIAEMWEHLNSLQSQLDRDTSTLSQQESDLSARMEELDAKDAALRGQLHDITRFNEQLTTREQELARLSAQLQVEKDTSAADQNAWAAKDADLQRRASEVQRRERAVTQRLSRLSSAVCPHCGKPTNLGQAGPAASS